MKKWVSLFLAVAMLFALSLPVFAAKSEATTGFRFRTITQEPAIRKAVDDIVYDFYGEENPCREEDYNLAPSEEMQMGGM